MPQYVAPMDTPFGPDGLPAVFDGGAWRSHDRRLLWNGAAWVPVKASASAPWLMKIGTGVVLLALLGFAVYTMISTQSEYTTGYFVGVVAFFAILIAIYRFVRRLGTFGIGIRAVTVVLALLKILTLLAHRPPT
jgi:hypothetical protein